MCAVGELLWMNAALFHAMGRKVATAAIWEVGRGDCTMMRGSLLIYIQILKPERYPRLPWRKTKNKNAEMESWASNATLTMHVPPRSILVPRESRELMSN